MPKRSSTRAKEHLKAEFWPEGLNAEPVCARIVSLAPGVVCLATHQPPAPGARFVAKFSMRGEFPIVAGCETRWRLERAPGEYWVSATFLTLDVRDWDLLYTAWQRHLGAPPARRASAAPPLAAAGR